MRRALSERSLLRTSTGTDFLIPGMKHHQRTRAGPITPWSSSVSGSAHITQEDAQGSSMQEVGKQLFHDLGLVNGDEVIGIVDDLDARLGQPLAETDCHLRPIVERFVSADDR
jgi:hypothetical protein